MFFLFNVKSIEWIAYDLHSGLHSIFWKLYDNFTGEDIIHGHEDIPAQGQTRVSGKLEYTLLSYFLFLNFKMFILFYIILNNHSIYSLKKIFVNKCLINEVYSIN